MTAALKSSGSSGHPAAPFLGIVGQAVLFPKCRSANFGPHSIDFVLVLLATIFIGSSFLSLENNAAGTRITPVAPSGHQGLW